LLDFLPNTNPSGQRQSTLDFVFQQPKDSSSRILDIKKIVIANYDHFSPEVFGSAG
jgi:hypothetical protein